MAAGPVTKVIPISIPAIGGLAYDVYTDSDESFVVTKLVTETAPVLSGAPSFPDLAEVGETLTTTPAAVTGVPKTPASP